MDMGRRDFLMALAAAPSMAACRSLAGSPAFRGTRAGQEGSLAGLSLRWCPPGSFRMGSPESETGRRADEAQVQVRLTGGFWMGAYEVTQGEWLRYEPERSSDHTGFRIAVVETPRESGAR